MKPRIRLVKAGAPQASTLEADYEAITLAEQAHRAMRRDIIAGALPAGQPLRLESLKARYGISFSPLREALNRLQSEQLVVSTTSRGFRVAPFSEEEMWDAIETRIVIECEALRRSLARGDDVWEATLMDAFRALVTATEQHAGQAPDPTSPADEQLEECHYAFHRSLLAACGSKWLLELSAKLYAQTERYRRPSLQDGKYWSRERDVALEHRQLVDAAVARDANQAAGLLARHYRETGRAVKKVLALNAERPVA
jgi:GntR family carbon starvation induced transcriptional regulator